MLVSTIEEWITVLLIETDSSPPTGRTFGKKPSVVPRDYLHRCEWNKGNPGKIQDDAYKSSDALKLWWLLKLSVKKLTENS
jgi:hypothetical protein